MRKMLRACGLVIAIACSVQAGEMQCGVTSQTPEAAGEIQYGLAGDMQYGLTRQSPDAGTEILIALLSLF